MALDTKTRRSYLLTVLTNVGDGIIKEELVGFINATLSEIIQEEVIKKGRTYFGPKCSGEWYIEAEWKDSSEQHEQAVFYEELAITNT